MNLEVIVNREQETPKLEIIVDEDDVVVSVEISEEQAQKLLEHGAGEV